VSGTYTPRQSEPFGDVAVAYREPNFQSDNHAPVGRPGARTARAQRAGELAGAQVQAEAFSVSTKSCTVCGAASCWLSHFRFDRCTASASRPRQHQLTDPVGNSAPERVKVTSPSMEVSAANVKPFSSWAVSDDELMELYAIIYPDGHA
jgi:hypothetical protein